MPKLLWSQLPCRTGTSQTPQQNPENSVALSERKPKPACGRGGRSRVTSEFGARAASLTMLLRRAISRPNAAQRRNIHGRCHGG
jgi:hypothetical protein